MRKFILALPITLLPAIAKAGTFTSLDQLDPSIGGGGGIESLASSLLSRIPYFLGGLALLAILYSGAMYIFAMGDPSKFETAKKNLMWTIIGIIAVAAIYPAIAVVMYLSSR